MSGSGTSGSGTVGVVSQRTEHSGTAFREAGNAYG